MNRFKSVSLFLLRIGLGWLFLYAGFSHLMDPKFSASVAGYLGHAALLPGLYAWLASPSMLPVVAVLNAWGLTLIGIALIVGALVRLASYLGALMMLLYYLPLGFPRPDAHSYIVDDHVIYILVFLVLAAFSAGRYYGLDSWLVARFPKLGRLS